MKVGGAWIGVLTAGFALSALAQTPGDFARGWPVMLPDEAPEGLYRLELTPGVYRTLADPELTDWMIFDARGVAVPVLPAPPVPAGSRPVPVFPLPRRAGTSEGDLRVSVERRADGRVVRVLTDGADRAPLPARRYLLDASTLAHPVVGLRLAWRGHGDFLSPLRVAASDDLTRWRTLASGETVGELLAGDARLARQQVDFAATRASYLRLEIDDVPAGRHLVSAELVLAGDSPRGTRQWLEATPVRAGNRTAERVFETDGPFPVDRATVRPLSDRAVATAVVQSAPSADGPWRRRGRQEVLRLGGSDDGDRADEALTFPVTRDRYWRLDVTPEGEPLSLELGWRPDEYLFIGGGGGSYLLAAGSANARRPYRGLEPDTLTGLPLAGTARLGAARMLAGDVALKPRTSVRWSRLMLWGVLVAGVGLVLALAIRLMRDPGQP